MVLRSWISRISPVLPLVFLGLLMPVGCQDQAPPKADPVAKAGSDDGDDHHHHHHSHGEKGPHGGALVAIGDDAAHLEVVLDAETGKVTVYVLDAAAKEAVAIQAEKLELALTIEHDHDHADGDQKKPAGDELPESATLVMTAVEPAGDGSASVYAGESEALKGADEFDAVLTTITVAGKDYKNVKFNYPDGNEHDHHHH